MAVSANGWAANPPRSRRKIVSPRSDVALTVANGAGGDLLLWVAGQFDQRVEDVDLKSSRGEFDDWGYAERPIRGGVTLSNHGSATAIDLNATRHPLGVGITKCFTLAQIGTIRQICRETEGLVVWGGEWRRPDGMHFELRKGSNGNDCARVLARLLTPPPTTGTIHPGAKPTLRLGDSGHWVELLHRFLGVVRAGDPGYGQFGALTRAKVMAYQKMRGLVPDGIVGPATWREMGL